MTEEEWAALAAANHDAALLCDAKRTELAAIGRAVLHGALQTVAWTTDAETAEQYCAALAEDLDSPFEDLQPKPVVLALIQDWLDEE